RAGRARVSVLASFNRPSSWYDFGEALARTRLPSSVTMTSLPSATTRLATGNPSSVHWIDPVFGSKHRNRAGGPSWRPSTPYRYAPCRTDVLNWLDIVSLFAQTGSALVFPILRQTAPIP